MDVVDFLIVGDELSVDGTLLDIPDGTGSVDGAGADEVILLRVPIEGCQRGAKLVVLNNHMGTFFKSNLRRTV